MLGQWHGRGRRFDPDQVHQLNQQLAHAHFFGLVAFGSKLPNADSAVRPLSPLILSPAEIFFAAIFSFDFNDV